MGAKEQIETGKTALGIEFGSTRIKAVLIDFDGNVLGTGVYDWENQLRNGIWTYSYEEIDRGLRGCYTSLRENVSQNYGVTIHKARSTGNQRDDARIYRHGQGGSYDCAFPDLAKYEYAGSSG
jgi:activator of 2-hydroxyglutaryl-CoA dehydratase